MRAIRVAGVVAALAVACTGCADPDRDPPPGAASEASPPAPTLSAAEPEGPDTVAEYLAGQGIKVSGGPDFEGKGPADQYAGEYLMRKGAHTSGIIARFYADWPGPSPWTQCDPTCSEGPTTIRVDGATPQDTWQQTMVVHGPGTAMGVEGNRVIERVYADGVKIVLEVPPWEGQSTPSLTEDQAEGVLEAAMREYLEAPKPPPNRQS